MFRIAAWHRARSPRHKMRSLREVRWSGTAASAPVLDTRPAQSTVPKHSRMPYPTRIASMMRNPVHTAPFRSSQSFHRSPQAASRQRLDPNPSSPAHPPHDQRAFRFLSFIRIKPSQSSVPNPVTRPSGTRRFRRAIKTRERLPRCRAIQAWNRDPLTGHRGSPTIPTVGSLAQW